MIKTIKEIYKYDKENDYCLLPLLSDISEGYEWWNNIYTDDNHEVVDELYARLYNSYKFHTIHDSEDYDSETAAEDFRCAVFELFMKNNKKYTELYRIEVIPDDDAYALTNNYDLHETYSGSSSGSGSAITGQRTDVTNDQIGSQNSAGLNKVTGWNSGSENTRDSNEGAMGSRNDTHQFTKGQQQDTSRTQGSDSHTLRRYGNIGVMTIQDMLEKQKNVWLPWSFLQIIFDDICKEYLLIGDDNICW